MKHTVRLGQEADGDLAAAASWYEQQLLQPPEQRGLLQILNNRVLIQY